MVVHHRDLELGELPVEAQRHMLARPVARFRQDREGSHDLHRRSIPALVSTV
jgi:hypothetical protein